MKVDLSHSLGYTPPGVLFVFSDVMTFSNSDFNIGSPVKSSMFKLFEVPSASSNNFS